MKVIELPNELHTQVYLPESRADCHKILCKDCICVNHSPSSSPCRFNVWLSTHPTEKPLNNENTMYQPETAEECKGTDCMKCVYYSYIPSSSSCPFEAWMTNHPVVKLREPPELHGCIRGNAKPDKKPTDTDNDEKVNQRWNRSKCNVCGWTWFTIHDSHDECPMCDLNKQDMFSPLSLRGVIKHTKPTDLSYLERACVLLAERWGLFLSTATPGLLRRLGNEKQSTKLDEIGDLLTEMNQSIIKLGGVPQSQPVLDHRVDRPGPFKMVYVKEKPIEKGQVGDLNKLSYVFTNADLMYGKEFYHHCPKAQENLTRLQYDGNKDEYICPICRHVFISK